MTKMILAVLIAASTSLVLAQELPDSTVTLYDGKDVPLSTEIANTFERNAIELLKSANFSSKQKSFLVQWGGINGIHSKYREIVQKKHLVISFKQAQTIKAIGGVYEVNEIVLGLGGPRVMGLYPIDGEGRVISHAFYNGDSAIAFMNIVKQADEAAAAHTSRP